MINTLIFDIGGVCLTDTWSHSVREAFAQRFGIPLEHIDAVSISSHDARVSGKIDELEFLQLLCEGYELDIEGMQRFFRDGIWPITGTLELLKALKATKKYRLLSLNNEAKGWSTYRITHFHLDDIFDTIYASCDFGMFKPDPEFYQLVIERERLIPSEAVFVDNKARNIAPATQQGLNTILFKNPEQLRKDLKALGIRLESE